MTFWELPGWAETKAKRDKLRQELEEIAAAEAMPEEEAPVPSHPKKKIPPGTK